MSASSSLQQSSYSQGWMSGLSSIALHVSASAMMKCLGEEVSCIREPRYLAQTYTCRRRLSQADWKPFLVSLQHSQDRLS